MVSYLISFRLNLSINTNLEEVFSDCHFITGKVNNMCKYLRIIKSKSHHIH